MVRVKINQICRQKTGFWSSLCHWLALKARANDLYSKPQSSRMGLTDLTCHLHGAVGRMRNPAKAQSCLRGGVSTVISVLQTRKHIQRDEIICLGSFSQLTEELAYGSGVPDSWVRVPCGLPFLLKIRVSLIQIKVFRLFSSQSHFKI